MTTTYVHTPADNTLSVSAHFSDNGQPASYGVGGYFTSLEAAQETAAKFPKSAGLRAFQSTLGWYDLEAGKSVTIVTYVVDGRGVLASNGVNKGVNETGLRRYRTLARTADKAGVKIDWTTPYSNSYSSREAFEAAIAAV